MKSVGEWICTGHQHFADGREHSLPATLHRSSLFTLHSSLKNERDQTLPAQPRTDGREHSLPATLHRSSLFTLHSSLKNERDQTLPAQPRTDGREHSLPATLHPSLFTRLTFNV
jgi:hypothetical protein